MASTAHRRYLINELVKGFETIGPEYEDFGTRLVDYLVSEKMQHRGLNLNGHPVGHTVDSVSETGEVAAEYSAQRDYFETPFDKIDKDLGHSRTMHPQAKRVFLLSNQECGPKAHTELVNLQMQVKASMQIDLEIYDSRRQAEFIFDHLLLNDNAVDALTPYLAPLEKVSSEFVATNLVPQLTDGYLQRDQLEAKFVQCIRNERVIAIAGISGSGKSETAVAVTKAVATDFEIIVWVSATTFTSTNDLHCVNVGRRGEGVNLLHLLRERACLVILDDLRLRLSTTELKKHCGDRSAILVTRQLASDGDIKMPLLDHDDARKLLEQGVNNKCPDEVFDMVWDTIGGHPLALRLMNAGVRNGGWSDLPDDCAAIGQYPDEVRLQRLADRLLGRLEHLLEKELSFFTWCDSARIDRAFARRTLAPVGIRKLDEACLLAADRHDVIRLHDVVKSALPSLHLPVDKYSSGFDTALDSHVIETAFGESNPLSFLNFCHIHYGKLRALLQSLHERSTCLYCLTHVWNDQEVDLTLVGDPITRANEIVRRGVPTDINVSAVYEAVEAIYRKKKFDSGLDAARIDLERYLGVITILIDSPGISKNGRRTALHHHAKILRNLQRYDETIAICERIISEFNSPATKLLLARSLIFDKNKCERAKNILFDLLEEARKSPETAEISVTLAAIETLGRQQLKQWFPEAISKYGDLVTNYIIESAVRGFDHAFAAFASIGRYLRYNDQDLFISVFSQLPRRMPEDAQGDKDRAVWGDILLTASEASSMGEGDSLAADAVQFYESLEKPYSFNRQQHGHALVLLNRFDEAVKVLQPLVDTVPNPWNRYWLSKALFGLGQLEKYDRAISLIDDALVDPKAKGFEAALLEHRWEIKKSRGDTDSIDDLQKALDSCRDQKHKAALEAKLAIECTTGRPYKTNSDE